MSQQTIEIMINKLAEDLTTRQKKIALAESCTGGWIAKVITDMAGSSDWFDRGFVTYSNEAKQDMLGVSSEVLSTHGAVSQQTVEAMASGVINNSLADCSVAVSGIAGPGGGTEEKPVGLVWFAWANKQGDCDSEQRIFDGDRNAVRQQAVKFALAGCLSRIAEMD